MSKTNDGTGDALHTASELVARLAECGSVAVAFSGGVDSAVVAAAAHRALGESAVAMTGVGPALAERELDEARRVAQRIGVRHVEIATDEIHREAYVANAPDRCFHCKDELYTRLRPAADDLGLVWIANGANADDRGDHRPGMRAAAEHRVLSPLMELNVGKEAVRQIAQLWGIPIWDKPASPCLASRIAYGEQVTPERLRQVEAAEGMLRALGLRDCRVRVHQGDLARIEVPLEWLPKLVDDATRREVLAAMRDLGFKAVTLDLAGLRSGSLNDLVPVEDLLRARGS